MALRGLGAFGVTLAAGSAARAQGGKVVNIGYQKYGNFIVLKARGTLEKRLRRSAFPFSGSSFRRVRTAGRRECERRRYRGGGRDAARVCSGARRELRLYCRRTGRTTRRSAHCAEELTYPLDLRVARQESGHHQGFECKLPAGQGARARQGWLQRDPAVLPRSRRCAPRLPTAV